LLGFWEFVRGDHPRWRAGVLVTLDALILVGFVILAAIGSD